MPRTDEGASVSRTGPHSLQRQREKGTHDGHGTSNDGSEGERELPARNTEGRHTAKANRNEHAHQTGTPASRLRSKDMSHQAECHGPDSLELMGSLTQRRRHHAHSGPGAFVPFSALRGNLRKESVPHASHEQPVRLEQSVSSALRPQSALFACLFGIASACWVGDIPGLPPIRALFSVGSGVCSVRISRAHSCGAGCALRLRRARLEGVP